jgi:hypothetical protein
MLRQRRLPKLTVLVTADDLDCGNIQIDTAVRDVRSRCDRDRQLASPLIGAGTDPSGDLHGPDEASAKLLPVFHARVVSGTLARGRLLAWDSVRSGEYLHSSVLVVTGSRLYLLHDVITHISRDHDELLNETTLLPPSYAGAVYTGLQNKVAVWCDQSVEPPM